MAEHADRGARVTLGVDIGGTFTDCVAIGDDGSLRMGKSLSTPPDFDVGFVDAIRVVATASGESVEDLLARTDAILHGTTVGSNALVQRRTARVGLLTSRGHRDSIFSMQSGRRLRELPAEQIAHVARHVKPEPIVPRALVRELDERVAVDGAVLAGLDPGQVRQAVAELVDEGVEAIAVSLLWSVANDAHERMAAAIIEELAPEIYLSTASQVVPRTGEYRRTVAAVVNALIGPEMDRYLSQLETRCAAHGYTGAIRIMTCSGGLISTEEARGLPLLTIGSGPVAGLIGAEKLTRGAPAPANVITADMGGTTLDVGVVREGIPLGRPTSWFEQYEYFTPTLDVRSVGAGGGSIIRFDATSQTLRVGPESAGSVPGPVCYGRGGTEPTVTDADVVAGFLNPDFFLGGEMDLDVEDARAALARVGAPLGLDAEQTATAALRIVDNQMADAIRLVTVNQGLDPREFSLYACGGAGAVHAAAIAAELGMASIVVPLGDLASGWSAFGVGGAEPLVVEEVAVPMREPFDPDRITRHWHELERAAAGRLARQGIAGADATLHRHADVRYSLQVNELEVDAPGGDWGPADVSRLIDRFETEYARLYGPDAGYSAAGFAITGLRVRGRGPQRPLVVAPGAASSAPPAPTGTREVRFHGAGGPTATAIHGPEAVRPGAAVEGPAIVELPDTSIVVPPGWALEVDDHGSARVRSRA